MASPQGAAPDGYRRGATTKIIRSSRLHVATKPPRATSLRLVCTRQCVKLHAFAWHRLSKWLAEQVNYRCRCCAAAGSCVSQGVVTRLPQGKQLRVTAGWEV